MRRAIQHNAQKGDESWWSVVIVSGWKRCAAFSKWLGTTEKRTLKTYLTGIYFSSFFSCFILVFFLLLDVGLAWPDLTFIGLIWPFFLTWFGFFLPDLTLVDLSWFYLTWSHLMPFPIFYFSCFVFIFLRVPPAVLARGAKNSAGSRRQSDDGGFCSILIPNLSDETQSVTVFCFVFIFCFVFQ